MISIFDSTNTTFAGNGDAVLIPTECRHIQAAAGKYDLTIKHPVDPWGKWKHIVPEAVIRAPVPEETIENAFSGLEADVYRCTTGTAMRTGPNEPTVINYSEWVSGSTYSVGDKVTYLNENFACTSFDEGSGYIMVPPNNSPWWTKIARYTSGDPVMVNLKAGAELYFVRNAGSGWYIMSTQYGMEGYVKASDLVFVRHLTPEETQPRVITEQLFRVKTVNVDTKSMTLTATAEHVSYDLQGVLIEDAKIARKNPAMTLAWIEQAFMIDYRGTIATNMTADTDGLYTGEIKGKNGVYALLDPDMGVVARFGAMYRRDNWDVFVMRKVNEDRGFRLRYGKNMLGVSWNIKSDGLVTRVVPVAKDEDGSDLYLDPVKWVDSTRILNYPVIRMERIKVTGQVGKDDGTETETNWTAATLREEMARKAQERFSIDKADQPVHEITVDFEMMGDTDEYRELKDLEQVLMYDTVVVINEEIGLSVSVEVTEIEYDCIRRKIKSLKLSNVNAYGGRNVSGFNVFNNSITGDKLTDDAGDALVGSATDRAVEESADYTDDEIAKVKKWVQDNYQPIE